MQSAGASHSLSVAHMCDEHNRAGVGAKPSIYSWPSGCALSAPEMCAASRSTRHRRRVQTGRGPSRLHTTRSDLVRAVGVGERMHRVRRRCRAPKRRRSRAQRTPPCKSRIRAALLVPSSLSLMVSPLRGRKSAAQIAPAPVTTRRSSLAVARGVSEKQQKRQVSDNAAVRFGWYVSSGALFAQFVARSTASSHSRSGDDALRS